MMKFFLLQLSIEDFGSISYIRFCGLALCEQGDGKVLRLAMKSFDDEVWSYKSQSEFLEGFSDNSLLQELTEASPAVCV